MSGYAIPDLATSAILGAFATALLAAGTLVPGLRSLRVARTLALLLLPLPLVFPPAFIDNVLWPILTIQP